MLSQLCGVRMWDGWGTKCVAVYFPLSFFVSYLSLLILDLLAEICGLLYVELRACKNFFWSFLMCLFLFMKQVYCILPTIILNLTFLCIWYAQWGFGISCCHLSLHFFLDDSLLLRTSPWSLAASVIPTALVQLVFALSIHNEQVLSHFYDVQLRNKTQKCVFS